MNSPGALEAVESVEIRPRVSGYITEIQFKAGAIVKKGDLLFVIDPRPYQADFDRAAAEVGTHAGAAQARGDRAGSRERIAQPRTRFPRASSTRKPPPSRVLPPRCVRREAAKNSAALNLEFTQIKSPIDGRVSDERVTVGNLVQPGRRSGERAHDGRLGRSDLRLSRCRRKRAAQIREAQRGRQTHKRARSEDPGLRRTRQRDRISRTKATSISWTTGSIPSTGTVRARVVLKNWNPTSSRPGFFVRVRIAGATPYRAALVDDKVISSQQGVKYAFVVKPDNTIERRNLETGTIFEGKRIVKSGLKDGEKVVSTRLQLVQPGMRGAAALPKRTGAARSPQATNAIRIRSEARTP